MSAYAVRGNLRVQSSATVLCVRRRPLPAPHTLSCPTVRGDGAAAGGGSFAAKVLPLRFESGWEVLLGQREVANWLRTAEAGPGAPPKIMRYAGEFSPAGGNQDEGEGLEQCARRELFEEYLQPMGDALPPDARLRPFVAKQTRPIRSRSNLIFSYVALESENQWLQKLDVAKTNAALRERRDRFAASFASGEFFALGPAAREELAPEVRQLQWMPLHEAVRHCITSTERPLVTVNQYQAKAFRKYGRKARDPMVITGATLMELEGFPDEAAVVRWCEAADLRSLAAAEQWLFDGHPPAPPLPCRCPRAASQA